MVTLFDIEITLIDQYYSPVFEHAKPTNHRIDTDKVNIFDKIASWFGRGVKEAAHIKEKRSRVNRNGRLANGRYRPATTLFEST